MTDPDTRPNALLAGLLAADDAPARDVAFEAAVVTRVEWRVTMMAGARLAGAGVLALIVLWTAWPSISQVLADILGPFAGSGPILLSVAAVATSLWAAYWYVSRAREAEG